jgi:hypothetical protein
MRLLGLQPEKQILQQLIYEQQKFVLYLCLPPGSSARGQRDEEGDKISRRGIGREEIFILNRP